MINTLTQFLIAVPAFLLVITVLVAVHEYGHYWMAKKMGIEVQRFSIGFGKPLIRKFFKNNETEFVVASLPLGGYVKMLDTRVDDDVSSEKAARAYNNKSPWQRIAVLFAGPLANLIFAVLVFWLLFVVGVSAFKPYIAPVEDSLASQIGLQDGDRVLAVNATEVSTFEEFVTELFSEILNLSQLETENQEAQIVLTVQRDSTRKDLIFPVAKSLQRLEKVEHLMNELGITNWQPDLEATIGQVSADSPASEAGLQSGDRVLEFDGVKINSWQQLVRLIMSSAGQSKDIEFDRDGKSNSVQINVGERQSAGQTIGIIGVSVQVPENYGAELRARQQYGPGIALKKAFNKTWDMCVLSLRMFKEMLKGNISLKNLSGPVSIAEQAGYSVQSGLDKYIGFFALISIALGIVNLLPVPMLDGGQIVLNLVELGKGSPVSERMEIAYQQFGFMCIVLLMGLAVFNDIERLLT